MVISIWPSRPTMRERAPLTGRTEFPVFERRATTYKKFRMRTTGQVRGDYRQGLRFVPELSAKTRILPAAPSLPTTEAVRGQEKFATRSLARMADICARNDNAEAQSSLGLAEKRVGADLVLVLGVYSFRSTEARI